jgi:6-pyruvoyltetrahydropterin/6-carboxytetrahydropterin synthase
MYQIAKDFHFAASHMIDGLPLNHPCSRLHGHNYTVTVLLEADELNAVGFVRDFRALDEIGDWIKAHLDHRHLNDMRGLPTTSSESLARWIFEQWRGSFPELVAVRVSEAPRTYAEYRP